MLYAGFAGPSGAGVQRPLMCGGVKQLAIGGENILCSVAVVDIEVHHRNAFQPVNGPCVQRPDGHVVEQAKAHGFIWCRVMSRRPHRAEGIGNFTRHDHVDRQDTTAPAARSAASPLPGEARVSESRLHETAVGNRIQQLAHMILRMNADERTISARGASLRRSPANSAYPAV